MLVREYFQDQRDKLMCGCGCGLKAPRRAVEMLYTVRIIMNIPIIVNSSIRCKKHNVDIGGSKNSIHLPYDSRGGYLGECAFDIVAESRLKHHLHEWRLIQVCQFVGFTGIGHRDNTFLHIDNRVERYDGVAYGHLNGAVWGYPK